MTRPALSTVACPDRTLAEACRLAAEHGFDGLELRSFGDGSADIACDPAHTDGRKLQRLFDDHGLLAAALATSVTFDDPVFPPVLGHVLLDREKPVRAARHFIDVAVAAQVRYVRFYGFRTHGRESRDAALRRICKGLARACDAARNRDVTVLIENGGSFATADDLLEILDWVGSPHLAAAYDVLAATNAEDDPVEGVRKLGSACRLGRVRDVDAEGVPVPLGAGVLPAADFTRALARHAHPDSWAVYTWDKLWRPEIAPIEDVIADAARLLFEWTAEPGAGATAAA